ncbi:hypothetical protein G7Y79_00069g096610 [Physcia stellaris]|nr:hypothetical protein G7Y79_00069g096610 [Physcia stellaris]
MAPHYSRRSDTHKGRRAWKPHKAKTQHQIDDNERRKELVHRKTCRGLLAVLLDPKGRFAPNLPPYAGLGEERVLELQILFSKKGSTEGNPRERGDRYRLRKEAVVEMKDILKSASPEWRKYMEERHNHRDPKSSNSESDSDELAEDNDELDQESDHGVDNVANEEEDVEMVDEMVDVVKSM